MPPPTPQGNAPLVPARWFDGRSSQPRPVLVGLVPARGGPSLALHPVGPAEGGTRVFTHGEVGWPEAWHPRRAPPRVAVDLGDHGSLEVADPAAWHAALAAAGGRASLAQRMQTRWAVLLGVAAVAAVGLTLFYRHGTPWAATQLTRAVPLAWEQHVARTALQQMDEGMLKPSQLPAARQAALRARFDALVRSAPPQLLRYHGYAPSYALDFRSGMPPNAFALPGGTVVMTDALVQEAAKRGLGDDALLGVLAHEMGHVAHRHTTRMVVEQGVLNVGLGLALGDVSAIVSTGGALLTGLAYRRDHEREADCFALALMRHQQLPTAPMADLLLAIAHDTKKGEAAQDGALDTLLSSHPGTVERARLLRAGQAPHCAPD